MDIKKFIKENLINGYKKGVWTIEEVNIMLLNYQLKGILTEDDVAEILKELKANIEEDVEDVHQEEE